MKIKYLSVIFSSVVIYAMSGYAYADICKANCRSTEGVICLERGPCQPANDLLADAARECREGGVAKYAPITKLFFLDVFSQVLRLYNELPANIDQLSDKERYNIEAKVLADKGINIFVGANSGDPLTREELTRALKPVNIEDNLGFSSGIENQVFNLHNEKFVVYDPALYVDEGKGFELWERRQNFSDSSADVKHYVAKIDDCNNARIVFGDNVNGRVPAVGSKIKAAYKILGREDEIVTECEIVMLLSSPSIAKSLRQTYNPARSLTKENFADLLIRSMHLEKRLPSGYANLSPDRLYLLETELLSKNGIDIFIGSNPSDFLTREELARVLYTYPVEEIVGLSNGKENQRFELNNAGFTIYDLHAFVNEGEKEEEWSKANNFMESSTNSKDYIVKLDSGNYASVYFGDGKKGKIPAVDSPIKVKYRLYSPVTMLTEDDIMCVLGKLTPVAEAYEPPPSPPDFPPPTDGFDDPATHI